MDKLTIENYFRGKFQAFYGRYLPKLQKASRDELKSLCPFHEDRDPSLSINCQTGLFKCFGCNAAGSIFDFYAKTHDLALPGDFSEVIGGIAKDFGITNGKGTKQAVKSIVIARYDYRDESGQLLYQIERLEPGYNGEKKTFRIRQQDGNGGWVYKKEDAHIVSYRLPEILKATAIIVVEGEKDSDNLTALGFTATTNPFGAGKWPDHFGPYFAEKDVVLLPHNDDQGRAHMKQVAANLKGHAAYIRWLELPDLPEKGDVSDFIATFSNREEAAERLAMMFEGAAEYDSKSDNQKTKETEGKKTETSLDTAILESGDFRRLELPPRKSYLHPIIQEQTIILCSGGRGIGKTWFGRSAADAITRRQNFGPWQAGEAAPVLYLDGEMATVDIQSRDFILNPHNERKAPFYIYSDAYANSLGLPRANLLNPQWRESICKFLTDKHIKVFIIDNLASLAGGIDENAKKDWDPVNAWIIELRFKGVCTFMQHHTNKDGGQRGTSAREDNVDLSILLKQPPNYQPENGADFLVTFTKTRLPLEDLKYVQDYRFTLGKDGSGSTIWTWATVRADIREQVLRMLDDRVPQKDIAVALGISGARVSQIKAEAIKESTSKKGKYGS